MPRKWKILAPEKIEIDRLSREAGITKFLAWLLLNRRIQTAEEVEKFLNPQSEHLFSGIDLGVFNLGAQMILDAVKKGMRFGIHGDYDVDGITATALLVEFFSAIGIKAQYFLPHRIDDGYGLREVGVKELKSKGVNFLIAVDCGISDVDAISLAKAVGLKVLVLDHHQPSQNLPNADLIIDPHLWENPCGMETLCSAGLVFFLLLTLRRLLREEGFFKDVREPNLKRSLDLVALGTVADVADVRGLNRILLSYGLREIEQSSRFGLRVLKKRAGVDGDEIGYGKVAFALAPRLNASGRINDADIGLELILSDDPKRANELADELERRNQFRQRIEEKILEDALKQINSLPDFQKRKSLVVGGEDWHPGVIGIVAQRLREQFYKPTIVISFHQGIGRGSGRSVNGFDLYTGLSRCKEYLLEFGGHQLACGISIRESDFEKFREVFEKVVDESVEGEALEDVLVIDAELPLYKITQELVDEIERLKPFGPGNPEPVMLAKSVSVLDSQIRKDKHLWLLLRERDVSFQGWFFRAQIESPKPGELIDIAYTIERSIWQGEPRTRLLIKDLKKLT